MSKTYQQSQEALVLTFKDLLNKNTDTTALVFAGMGVYREVKNLALSKEARLSQSELAKVLDGTRRLISGNLSDAEFRDELEDYYKLIKRIHSFPWGKLLSNAMMFFAGTCLLVLAGAVALASFGIIAPFSLFGMAVGASVSTGILASGVGTLFGAGPLMRCGVGFREALTAPALAREMNATVNATSAKCGMK